HDYATSFLLLNRRGPRRVTHSFPTRRSSDLAQADSAPAPATASAAEQVVAVSELSSIPAPTVPAKAWLTLDVNSGQIVGANNPEDRKSTRLNSSHVKISYAVFCLKKKITIIR